MLFLQNFDDITEENVKSFSSSHQEGIRVEYKINFDRNVRRALPKVISSFGNTLGGILILGINAPNGIPQEPFEGFEPSNREEIKLTIENICLSNIYPILLPSVKIVDIENSSNVFVVIETIESSISPHTIENSTKIYIRTGNQSVPYKLADLDRIELLQKKRSNSVAIRERILSNYNYYESKLKSYLTIQNRPSITVYSFPKFMQRPVSDLETAYQSAREFEFRRDNWFNVGNQLSRTDNGAYSLFYNNEINFSALSYCGIYGEVIMHRSLELTTSEVISTVQEDNDRLYIQFSRMIFSTAYNLLYAKYFYENCSYKGDVEINVKVDNILDQHLLYRSGIDAYTNYYATLPTITGKSSFSSNTISEELCRIITDSLHKILWAFTQGYDSVSVNSLNGVVEDILRRNRYIS